LAKFSYNEFKMQKIEIRECEYEGSWIEVGLKAEAANRSSNRN